jgi:hypothetical protein
MRNFASQNFSSDLFLPKVDLTVENYFTWASIHMVGQQG